MIAVVVSPEVLLATVVVSLLVGILVGLWGIHGN